MRIHLKQMIESGCPSRAEIRARLDFWASRYGFQRANDDGDAFVFHRGSHWHAFYTFDIRKIPTTVTVAMIPGDHGECMCSITCGSWLQVSTPGDQQRLSEQMDLLEACLKGALSSQATPTRSADSERRTANTSIQELQR